jgi:hypothetical protein
MRYSLKDRYGSEELDLSKWEFNDQTRNLSNSTIKLELTIPEGLNFHNPKDLKMREKTGSGQIAGIISFSNTNPNSYPYIRIFYIPQFVKVDISTIREEYLRVMEFEKNQGEIEEIRELGERTFQTKNWKGNFWTFYDILRPRYSKRGFYIVEREDGTSLVLDLCENLVKGQEHEDIIKNLLESVK